MCNEKKDTVKQNEDIRFLEYRLEQLEQNLRNGQEKIEKDHQQSYHELLTILQSIQEGNSTQNQKLTELSEKMRYVEEKMLCLDKLKEAATKNSTRIHEIERRLDIYKQVLFVIATGVALALLTELVNIL